MGNALRHISDIADSANTVLIVRTLRVIRNPGK